MKYREIVPTPRSRIIALSKFAIWPLTAYALLLIARHHSAQIAHLPVCDQLPWMRAYSVVAVVSLAVLSFICVRSGWRIWRSDQYPAPGASVLFTTRVWTGWWARLNAVSFFVISGFLIASLAALLQYCVVSGVGPYILGLRGCEA